MNFAKEQIDQLSLYTEEARQDSSVIALDAYDLVVALLNEAKRIHREDGGTFSEALIRSKIDSLPFHLKFYKYLSRLQEEAYFTPEDLEKLKKLGF